jgi:hypothetical protein
MVMRCRKLINRLLKYFAANLFAYMTDYSDFVRGVRLAFE